MIPRTTSLSAATVAALVPVLLLACVSDPGILGAVDEGAGDGEGSSSAGVGSSMTGNQGTEGSSSGDASTGGPDVVECPNPDTWGAQAAPSMTPAQWDGVVADLVGVDADLARRAHAVDTMGHFDLGIASSAADDVGGWATQAADLADLSALLPCDPDAVPADGEQACWDGFVPDLVARAWRRDPSAAELAELDAIATGPGTFAERVRLAIAAVIGSENLWRITPTGAPDGAGAIALDGDALALRLALFLWHALPDDELRAVAAEGGLSDPTILDAQIERMLASPRAERMIADFHTQWLDIDRAVVDKNAEIFPGFTPELWTAMRRETGLFAIDVILHDDARLATMLTAPHTFLDAQLAATYGDAIEGPAPDSAVFERVELDPVRRGGVLTQPAWLTAHAHRGLVGFTPRGKWIREQLLCAPIPPPPPEVDPSLPGDAPTDAGAKAFRDGIVGDPACVACHDLMDPFSFAFDNYDAVGAWTDVVMGAPVDPSGQPGDFAGFADRQALLDLLVDDAQVAACVPEQWAGFALGRRVGEADACFLEALRATFVDGDGDLRAVIAEIARSDAFGHMRVE